MIELEIYRIKHDRTELYVRSIQPILWLVVYGSIMNAVRAIPTGDISYIEFITPGIIIQSTTFVSIFYGLTIVWERESGILKKLLVTPIKRYAIVIGRSMAAGIRSIFQFLILLPIAFILGVEFVLNIGFFLLSVLILFFASGGFAAISIIVASFFKTREKFMGIGQAIIFPLFFLSNALYPIDVMPSILQLISNFNPLTYIVDAVRGLLITGDISRIWVDIGVILIFDICLFAIATKSFKKIIE